MIAYRVSAVPALGKRAILGLVVLTFLLGSLAWADPVLRVASYTLAGGDGDGLVDPNECNELTLNLANNGTSASNVYATVSTSTPGVYVTQANSRYPALGSGETAPNQFAFMLSTSQTFFPGQSIRLSLLVSYNGGQQTLSFSIDPPTRSVSRFDSAGALPIADKSVIEAPIQVAGLEGTLTSAAVSLYLTHERDADLRVQLVAPDGLTVLLVNKRGGNGNDYGSASSDAQRTVFTDDASQSIASGSAPFVGSFRPEQTLGLLKNRSGNKLNGSWKLRISDMKRKNVGTLQCWSLLLERVPNVASPFGPCSGTPTASLSLTTTAPASAVNGQQIDYTLQVTNTGATSATGVTLTEALPAELTLLAFSQSQGTLSDQGGVLTFDLGTILAGQSASVGFRALVNTDALIMNRAWVELNEMDPDPSDNVSTAVTLASPVADLVLQSAACAPTGYVGRPLSYSYTVTNNGPDAATNATLLDTLPAQAQVHSARLSQGSWRLQSGAVVCELGTLEADSSASVHLEVIPRRPGMAVNLASVLASEVDLAPADNDSSSATHLKPFEVMIDDGFTTNCEDATLQNGWSKFGMYYPKFAQPAWTENYGGAFGARVWPHRSRFRVAGYFANQPEWLPYSQVGTDNYVRVKYYVWAGGQSTTSPLEIPNLRLRAQTRYAVNSMLEVLHHSNNDPNGTEYSSEFRPSTDPNHPSLYRVDFDPVDVPYLQRNGDYEGVQRAFEVYATDPQDNGYLCVGESVIGTYAASLLDDSLALTSGTKIYAPSASDAGDLKVFNSAAELQIKNIELQTSIGLVAPTTTTLPLGSYSEGSFGITLDTSAVAPAPVCGIVSREFNTGEDPAGLIRIEEGKQYKIRWHLTSTQATSRQAQIRLRARTCKYAWTQKFEIGGAWATGDETLNANNAIAQQALPGEGCQNPDRNPGESRGGWYTMLFHSPLSREIRGECPGQPLSKSMPKLSACPPPGSPDTSNTERDLKVGCDLVDTLSSGANAYLEQGNFTLDRIEVTTYELVDDEDVF